jgi:hypothetical protein
MKDVRAPWSNLCALKKSIRVNTSVQLFIIGVGLAMAVGWWLHDLAFGDNLWRVAERLSFPLPELFLVQELLTIYVILLVYVALRRTSARLDAFPPLGLGSRLGSSFQFRAAALVMFDQRLLACSASIDEPVSNSGDAFAEEPLLRPARLEAVDPSPETLSPGQPKRSGSAQQHPLSKVGAEPLLTSSDVELLENLSQRMVEAFPAEACLVLQFDQVTGSFEQLHLGRKYSPVMVLFH